jgi:uncharacterized protein (TIGR02217 family)
MAFHEIRFPIEIAIGSRGGPERRTEIVELGSGREERNSRWAHSRRRFNAGYGAKRLQDLSEVIRFFEERRGRLHGFRYRDPLDYRSCPPNQMPGFADQALGTGNGTTNTFQLIKTYGSATNAYRRTIAKPVAGTVRVAVNNIEKLIGPEVTVDTVTGQILFLSGHVPQAGEFVTAGFEFDVPVRFDTDRLDIDLSAFGAGEIPDIPIIEIIP